MSQQDGELLAMLLHGADAFLRDRHSLKRTHDFRRSRTGFDRSMWEAMAQCGWLGICLPEELGGAGLEAGAAAELAARFGAVLLPEPFAQCAVAPASVLAAAPASPLRTRLAEEMCAGSTLLALVWQAAPGQCEPLWQAATLHRHGDGWLLRGECVLVEAPADGWLVAATEQGQPCLVAVPASSAGLHATTQPMTDGTATATLRLQDVRLADDAVLLRGETARTALATALDDARLVLAAQLAGVSEGALTTTVQYTQQRVQFGQSLASFQVLRHRMVDLDLAKRLAFASWRHAARAKPEGRSAAISAAKARCGDTALLAARAAIQLHGAIGYTREADPGLFLDSALRLGGRIGAARIVSGMGERPVPVHLARFGLASFTTGCGCIAPRVCMLLLHALQRGDLSTAEQIHARFMPLENLRESISLIRVLHDAVTQSGVADMGAQLPLLSASPPERMDEIRTLACALLAYEQQQVPMQRH